MWKVHVVLVKALVCIASRVAKRSLSAASKGRTPVAVLQGVAARCQKSVRCRLAKDTKEREMHGFRSVAVTWLVEVPRVSIAV